MKSLKVSTCSPERKPGVARRGVLSAIAAGAAAAATPAASNIFPGVDLTIDSVLVDLWRQLLDTLDALDANAASYEQAKAKLPEWARYTDDCYAPAWTANMLAEHKIPAEMGNRFARLEIEKLNKATIEAAYEPLFAASGCSTSDLPACASTAQFFETAAQQVATRTRFVDHPYIVAAREEAERRLAAWEARVDQRDADEDRCGLSAIGNECEELRDRRDAIIDQLTATPHRSATGMMIRLRVWLLQATDLGFDTLDDLDYHDAVVLSLIREAEATDAALMLPLPASLRKVLGGEA